MCDKKMSNKKSCHRNSKSIITQEASTFLYETNVQFNSIYLIEEENNKKGDLFNRLVFDVLHSLGYGEPRFNIPNAGNEIDMIVKHNRESKYAFVESKAQNKLVGGDDINKFVGAVDVVSAEYEQNGNSVVGYYISRMGFTETAIEQERKRANINKEKGNRKEVILIGPNEIVNELVRGKVICSLEKAVDVASRTVDKTLQLCEKVDLIASEYGWIWLLYYSECPQQAPTHFTFVHADGNRLLNGIAKNIIDKCKAHEFSFSKLNYLCVPTKDEYEKQKTQHAYFNYLKNELGEIQFEGMPTDKEAGAIKVNLESIFVPLEFEHVINKKQKSTTKSKLLSIEEILMQSQRVAILAKPGGGKSTLIRRMALAYAFPERRRCVDDKLPNIDFFPVYIRCRDLGNDIAKSIGDIIGTIVKRAEINQYEHAFNLLVRDELQDGRVLLLIDGLDEISSEHHRISFVNQLRTFIATYPNVHMVITSREAGFRAVAETIAGYCEQYSIAPLNLPSIRKLCLKWHKAILGDSPSANVEADKIYEIIANDSRIIALAKNPLLLTTLLFVKRWVGYLPTKKFQLYEEMIKLLLVTWNAVAHDRLDKDETEPQLAFVAYRMTLDGQQKITRDKLEKYIIEARATLPELLGYTTISPSQFIDKVEERSSLLIQYGYEENSKGKYVPSYEFSHLSFQEYLTAKAVSENWISSGDIDILHIVESHVYDEHWKEVIPMIAVSSDRRVKSKIIEYLINLCDITLNSSFTESINDISLHNPIYSVAFHIANCIASEVPMNEKNLEQAIRISIICREGIDFMNDDLERQSRYDVFSAIINSKYGDKYREIVENTFIEYADDNNIYAFSEAWMQIYETEHKAPSTLNDIINLLDSDEIKSRLVGAYYVMDYAFRLSNNRDEYEIDVRKDLNYSRNNDQLCSIFSKLYDMLFDNNKICNYMAVWAIAWSGYNETDLIPKKLITDIFYRLIELWMNCDITTQFRRNLSWAIHNCCMLDLNMEYIKDVKGLINEIDRAYNNTENDYDIKAAVSLGILLRLWDKKETTRRLRTTFMSDRHYELTPFLKSCGYDHDKIEKEIFSKPA